MKSHAILASALLALAPLTAPLAATATTVGFTYAGTDPDDDYVSTAGSGVISFDGTGAIGLANLTGFSFAQTTTLSDPGLAGAGSFTYRLADVLSFSGVVTGNGFSALTLKTRTVSDATGFLADESFQIRLLRLDGASTAFDDFGGDQATLGTVRLVAAVPEPAVWGTLMLGFGLVGYAMRRRRVGVSPACAA